MADDDPENLESNLSAEMAVSPLIDRLIILLTHEARLFQGIHGELADIKDVLESIQSFLKDADARAEAPSNMSHHGSEVRKETSPYFSLSLLESNCPSAMAQSDSQSPLFFPDNMSPKFSLSNSIELIFPPARSETTDGSQNDEEIIQESIFSSAMSQPNSQSPLFFPDNMSPKFSHSNSIEFIFPPAKSETTDGSQNDEEIIQKPFISSFSHLFPPGTMSDSDSANSVCDYGPTTHSISLLFPAYESDIEAETETGSLAFNGTTSNLSHSIMQFYLSHSIMQFFPPARSPSQTDISENYVITRTDFDGSVFNGTPPAHSPKFSGANSIKLFFPIAKTWVKQLREIVFRIDVAIDQYLLQVAQHGPHRRGFTGFVHKTTHSLKTLKSRHKIASEIQKIKALVHIIKERSIRYGFQSIGQGSNSGAWNVRWQDPRMDSLFLKDVDFVGIESPKDELIDWLIKGNSYRTVVSVVGMGGLGKTILAKIVYDHHMVRKHFDCHAWISVSQSYNMIDLIRRMVKQFCEARKEFPFKGIDSADEILLISKAREYLQEKRYVVVFDDVWEIDFWGKIEHALPDNTKGPRILITTQKLDVANFCQKASHVEVHNLQPLPPNKAWELFCKRAFQFEIGGHCPPMLAKLSHDILKKCEGLPLAIIAIGSLLSTKNKTLFEWQKLHDSLGFELGINPRLAIVSKILSLSFEDLPYNLKSCILYLGMYPEDYSISYIRLIRQWIAEGFVKAKEGKTFEEVAQEYLTELIHRSLVQVLEVNFDGKVRQCRLHYLFREIVLQKMKDFSFCHVLSKQESDFVGPTRRMSVDAVSCSVLKGIEDAHIHSLLFFNINEFAISFMSKFLQNFKLVKILDFENTPLDHLPEEVGNLFHLRYLNLNHTKVKTLPNSIGKLQNLETLLMWQTAIQEIPVTINMLHKLRCLKVCYFDVKMDMNLNITRGVKLHWSIGCLKALTELQIVDTIYGGVKLIEELGKLSQLTDLALVNLTRETGRALCVSIENMNCLKDLFVSSINEDEVIDLQPISSPPKCLQFLRIEGRLAKLPDWISELQHLVSLKIYWTRLSDDPLIAFQNLPNLVEFILGIKAYNGEQLQIGKGGFSKLKELRIGDLSELNSLNIEKEAFPLLQKLTIEDCPQLKEVPSGFQHLRNLKELNITDMPTEFEKSLDPEQGSHYWIIQHVPSILLNHKVRKGVYGYESRNLHSKDLERSRGQTINQDDNNKNNISGDDIRASIEKGKQAIST